MGPVNRLAVVAAALAALAFGAGAQGPAARRPAQLVLAGVLLLLTAAMMGHMFARVGAATLAVKPWLDFHDVGRAGAGVRGTGAGDRRGAGRGFGGQGGARRGVLDRQPSA
jgi:hypothetical protein